MEKIIKTLDKEMKKAANKKEVPIAALIMKNNVVLCSAHNSKISKNDPTAHAEVICIKKASRILNTSNLGDCELYVTIKPCKMCEYIINEARIKKVYYFYENNKKINITTKYEKIILDKTKFMSKKLSGFFKTIR